MYEHDKNLIAQILRLGQNQAIALCEYDAQQIAELIVFAGDDIQTAINIYYENHREELDERMRCRMQRAKELSDQLLNQWKADSN